MYKNLFFLLSISFLTFLSCNKNEETTAIVRQMWSKNIRFPENEMKYLNRINKRDSLNGSFPYKMIVYVDSTNCGPCKMNNMQGWHEFLDLEKKGVLKMLFIFEPKCGKTLEMVTAYINSNLEYGIYLDTLSAFKQSNTFIPNSALYHTFLIDRHNNIVLVGDPCRNEQIKKLLYEIVEDANHSN